MKKQWLQKGFRLGWMVSALVMVQGCQVVVEDSPVDDPTGTCEERFTGISCKSSIPNASEAFMFQACEGEGKTTIKLSCQLQSCEDGYEKVGNLCVLESESCTPGEVATESCASEIENALTATKTKVCRQRWRV